MAERIGKVGFKHGECYPDLDSQKSISSRGSRRRYRLKTFVALRKSQTWVGEDLFYLDMMSAKRVLVAPTAHLS
jgi:hypothetical protein